MTKPEEGEKGEKATGCYTLQCSECAFKETIWGGPDEGETNAKALDACAAHCKRLKHKKILVIISTFWIARYDNSKNTMNCESAPRNEFYESK
jgi:hypothetical protein